MTTEADIEDLRCQLKEWDAALTAAAQGAEYSIDGITVTRQDVEGVINPNRRRLIRNIRQMEAAANGANAPSIRVARMVDPWA